MTEETKDLKQKVLDTLEIIRPNLQADGGDVEFVDLTEDNVVKVKLTGACHGCPMAAMTLQMGIQRILQQQVPEITGVESVVDEEE